jgi:hypothetical protein
MSHEEKKLLGRVMVVLVVGAALLVATFSKDALVLLGHVLKNLRTAATSAMRSTFPL